MVNIHFRFKSFLISFLITLGVVSCSSPSNTSLCKANELLLEESFFPSGATIGDFMSPLPEGTTDSVGHTAFLGQGFIIQDVYPFSTTSRAISEFEENLRDPVFTPREPAQGWLAPSGITDFSFGVDSYRIACGTQNGIPMCRSILQHGPYYVYLNAHTYENEFSQTEFLRIVEEISKRMQNCVAES